MTSKATRFRRRHEGAAWRGRWISGGGPRRLKVQPYPLVYSGFDLSSRPDLTAWIVRQLGGGEAVASVVEATAIGGISQTLTVDLLARAKRELEAWDRANMGRLLWGGGVSDPVKSED